MVSTYKQICDAEKKQTKQTTMDIFQERMTPEEKRQAGPSGSNLEEGILIGHDSSIRVIVPEDLSVDKMWRWMAERLMILALGRPTLICVFVS